MRIALKEITQEALKDRYAKAAVRYEEVLDVTRSKITGLLREADIRAAVKFRFKSFASFYAKVLKRAQAAKNEEEIAITDLVGIRIVCPFIEDTVKAEEIVRRNFDVVERERKGDNLSPREFGYESIHYIIRLSPEEVGEIQIRTTLQDAWAEVEHELLYKGDFTPFDEPLRRKLAAVNASLSLADIVFQEIRDYTKSLEGEITKRRKTFMKQLKRDVGASIVDIRRTDAASPVSSLVSSVNGTLDTLLLEGLTAHNKGRYAEAAEIYTRILDQKPRKAVTVIVLIHRGMAYFSQERHEDAREDFSAALSMAPENDKAYYYRGVVRRFLSDDSQALADFDKAVELNPYFPGSYLARAQIYFALGDYSRASADAAAALRIDPDDTEVKNLIALVRKRL